MEDLILKTIKESNIQLTAASLISAGIVAALTAAAMIALSIIHKRLRLKYSDAENIKKLHNLRILFRALKILAIIAGLIGVLQSLGVNLTGMTMIFGVLAVVIVLALKDALQDVFAGLVLMSDRYFSVGDAVEFDGKDGIVVGFTARTTKIEFLDDRSVMSIGNRNITKIRRLTHQVDIDLPLSYELSRKEAISLLSAVCMRISALDGVEKCELKGTQDFASSAIIYKIRFFCEPHDRPDIRRAALAVVRDSLEQADVHIPYQQLDIHEK